MAVLTPTTTLADKAPVNILNSVADGFFISDLRFANIGLNPEFAFEAIHNNLQVQFTHPRNNGLSGVWINSDVKSRIFFGQLAQRDAELILIGLGSRFNCHRNHGLGKIH